MNESTIPQPSPSLLQLLGPAFTEEGVELKYATINATVRKGGDWVAVVALSARYGMAGGVPEYWQYCRLRGNGPQTMDLVADEFYRARLGGQQFGLYIDSDGQINYLSKRTFERELGRRFRDRERTVDLECGDWASDPFSKSIPAANLGESRYWLDPQ
jgi:hypothetical protein